MINEIITNNDLLKNKNSIDNNLLENNNSKNTKLLEDNNIFFRELLVKQLKNVCPTKKLSYNDIKRISNYLNVSIFDNNKCSLWNGYITNEKNQTKGTYINFYYNKKKIALHRLLYINYIGEITNDEYIKFSCENKGKCCNINHMKKYSYIKQIEQDLTLNIKNDNKLHINTDKKKLIIEF
jgi:hypothetical protein